MYVCICNSSNLPKAKITMLKKPDVANNYSLHLVRIRINHVCTLDCPIYNGGYQKETTNPLCVISQNVY